MSFSCEPTSTSLAPSSTTMRSAIRTVEKRCDTRMVMRPSAAPRFTATAVAAARGCSIALEQRVLGLGVEGGRGFIQHQQKRMVSHESAREREFLPLTEGHVDAARPGRSKLRVESRRQPRYDVLRARPINGSADGGPIIQPWDITHANRVERVKLEAKEILKCAGQARAPGVGRHPRERHIVHEDRTRGRLVHLRKQLDERGLAGTVFTHDCHDRSRGQQQRHVVENETRRAGIRKRDAIETNTLTQGRGHGQISRPSERRGVVFQPRETLRPVHPDASQKSDLANRCADVRRQARAGREHEEDVAGRRAKTGCHEHHRADVRATEYRPRCGMPDRRGPPRGRDRSVPLFPCVPTLCHEASAKTDDPHFLPRRRRRGRCKEMASQPGPLRSAFLRSPLDRRPPC